MSKSKHRILMTTTSTLEGYTIEEYLGIVTGEVILGANFFRDLAASITDVLGGRSGAYEKSFLEAKQQAQDEMVARALDLGATAILGVDLDFETVGSGNSMMMVSYSGTAVVARRN